MLLVHSPGCGPLGLKQVVARSPTPAIPKKVSRLRPHRHAEPGDLREPAGEQGATWH